MKLSINYFVLALIIYILPVNSQTVKVDSTSIAYYPFNGNTNDESGNGNNGINYGQHLLMIDLGTKKQLLMLMVVMILLLTMQA